MELRRRNCDLFEVIRLIFGAMTGQLDEEERGKYNQMIKDGELLNNGNLLSDPRVVISELDKPGHFDTESAYQEFKLRRGKIGKSRRMPLGWIAASLLIPVGVALSILLFSPAKQPEVKQPEEIQPVASAAWLRLSDGRRIGLGNYQDTLWEQDGTRIANEGGVLNYRNGREGKGQVVYNELTVPRGGEYMLELSDGTRVWLNSESVLKYPLHFSGSVREVFLRGEAYFSVTKDLQRTFKVHTSRGDIHVLGTEFNVRDYYEENSVVTTLVGGKILYRDKDDYSRVAELSPGFQVIDAASLDDLQLREVDVTEFVGWKDGLYIFRNLTLEQIMKTVARNYDAEICWNSEKVKRYRFSGDLKKYERVEKFLDFIQTGGDVSFTARGKTIFVNEK